MLGGRFRKKGLAQFVGKEVVGQRGRRAPGILEDGMHLGFEGLVKVRRQSGQQCRVGPVPRGIVLHRLRRLDSGDLAVRRLGPGPEENNCQNQARDGQSGGPVAREGFGRAGCGGWRI